MGVFLAVAAGAQSLTGKNWFGDMTENGNRMGLILKFNDNGSCAASLIMTYQEVDDGITMIAYATMTAPGTYTRNGNNLSVKIDHSKAHTKIEPDFKGVEAAQKKIMAAAIQPELDKMKPELEKEMVDAMFTNEEFVITKITAKSLVLNEGMNFVAVPDGYKMK